MSITIQLREPWTLHPEKLKMPFDENEQIVYEALTQKISGQKILDAIGLQRKEICFARVQGLPKQYLSRQFIELEIEDGAFIDLFPFTIAG